MRKNTRDLIKTLLKAIGIITIIAVIILGIEGYPKKNTIESFENKNVENNNIEINKKDYSKKENNPVTKTYAFCIVTIKKPVVETGYNLEDDILTGNLMRKYFCNFNYETEYYFTENIVEFQNFTKRDRYNLIDRVRQNPNLKWRISAYNSNIRIDLEKCPQKDKERFEKENYRSTIDEIKVLTFDNYEDAWEEREKRR
tara:strand:+ start:453 stop:1049 length:597 start_codon:yes stop_codon:yes gene_type:complete